MQLFYAPDIARPPHALPPDEAAHAVRVMRLGKGDQIMVADGAGTMYACEVEEARPDCCRVRILRAETDCGRLPYRLTLAVAPPKNPERWEWFVEKAVEVGVERIVPLDCARGLRVRFRPERTQRIITAAMKQSLKAYRPLLSPPTAPAALLAETDCPTRLIAHCDALAQRIYLGDALQPRSDCLILIGPEGDFTPQEIEAAHAAGCRAVTLGPQRLRTETAAVAAAVIVSAVNCLAR